MKKAWVKLIMLLTGIITVALPDSNQRLFSISADHGLSLQDTVGILLVLVAYFWLIMDVWNRRKILARYTNTQLFKVSLFVSGVGYGLIIASVMNDYKTWWIVGIGLVTLVHILIFYLAFK
jgi:hypothetical protein